MAAFRTESGMSARFLATVFGLVLALALGIAGRAEAAPTVHVVDTWPPGERVTLARNETFHLRLAWSADTPIGIWLRPYFRGKRARAGTSPSPRYSGNGETIAWLFLAEPDAEVDEIRIVAGDGGVDTTHTVATHRVRIVGGGTPAARETPPPWVSELRARARAAMEEQKRAHVDTPASAFDMLLFAGFMLGVPILLVLGFVAPALAYRRWRGGWRIAAAVPGIMMAFVVLRIAIGVAIDPTSHNLWPFETLMAGAVSTGAIAALLVLRRVTGAARSA